MHLILCRHGNTFAAGDKVIFAGCREDLPLVERGLEQARLCAAALQSAGIKPAAVYSGPLQRTQHFARIIADTLQSPAAPILDRRLDELDYGLWAGLSSAEIAARFGAQKLAAWDRHSVWPGDCAWGSSEQVVLQEVRAYASVLRDSFEDDEVVVAVSSNGRLRYFLTLLAEEFNARSELGNFKVGTGHICALSFQNSGWILKFWNEDPTTLETLELLKGIWTRP